MARAAIPFAVTNVTTWTYEALKVYVGQNRSKKPKCYFLSFFGWSYEEYVQAREYTITELETQPFGNTAGFPTAGPKARLRHVIQKKLVREHPDLFVERHGSDPPTWPKRGTTSNNNQSCRSNELLPVEIWIYGGGFSTGGQDVPYQIPSQWVERAQDHIVVSINYRVNIFGFPNAAGLSDQNVGLLDQRAAVEWVRDNIVRFGGDPSRMLLWGQSAGSISVDYYNYAYPKDPIVSAFSMDSGTAFSVIQSVDTQHTNFTFVASQLGCANSSSPEAELACIRKVPAKDIEDFVANYQINGTSPGISFLPIPDEKVVFSNYTSRALAGNQANIPAIIGTNAQDGVPFAPYSPSGPNATLAQLALLRTFFCPATESIRLRQLTNRPTYRYVYSGNFSNIAPAPWLGAYHSSELPLLFGTYDNFRGAGPALEGQTSVAMQDAWVAFTKDGMQGIESTGWQEYEVLGENTVRDFGDGVAVKDTDLKYLDDWSSDGKRGAG
ncbi:acetylcholinesterase [Aureobasidium pullulans]|uniref:Carboxylic ester hydrolase n=1 Tax=Aureobasidium pullulans TaxID=5580 RepID=A0A4T0AJA6_AURPU|nr:acetylcholinesterase [Aureobasidium pullulans]